MWVLRCGIVTVRRNVPTTPTLRKVFGCSAKVGGWKKLVILFKHSRHADA